MAVIAAVGLPGSGKTEAAQIAEEMGMKRVSMGDVVRREIKRRDLDVTDENIERISTELREQHGDAAVARLCVKQLDMEKNQELFIDGIRGLSEIEYFRDELDRKVTVLAIKSAFSTRYDRISTRGRTEDIDTREMLRARDERELEWGLQKAIEMADITIHNDGSLDSFQQEIASTISQLTCSPR